VRRLRFLIPCISLVALATSVYAQKASSWEGPTALAGPVDLGVVFNTPTILLDIESYQGGIGVKIGSGMLVLRGMLDILVNTRLNPVSLSLQAVIEKHLSARSLSPYWGGLLELGITSVTTQLDQQHWTQLITLPVSVGAVCGVEIFLLDFLSVFLEYEVALDIGLNINRQGAGGSVSSTTELTYKFDLGLGNSSMIGVVIYILRQH
jgi:hypothetical protein